jgi:hypothetical protein
MCKGGKREERSDGIGCVTKRGCVRRGDETINGGDGGGEREREKERLIVYGVST